MEQFPSGVLPTSLHLALLELVTSGFCSAVLRFVKCEVTPLLKVRPYFFILILPTFMARPPKFFSIFIVVYVHINQSLRYINIGGLQIELARSIVSFLDSPERKMYTQRR